MPRYPKAPGMIPRNSFNILVDLAKAKRPLSVRRIAERTGRSWKTTSIHLKNLESYGLVVCTHGKRRNYCMISNQLNKRLIKRKEMEKGQ